MTKRKDSRKANCSPDFGRLAGELAQIGRGFYARGWSLGTSGNLSAVSQRDPLRLAITASGLDKGLLAPAQILEIDAKENVLQGNGKPSAEAALHVSIVHARAAGCVLHTHSVWSTVLSQQHAREGHVEISGYEMLKGLEGVCTHNHTEHLPILENSQNMKELSDRVADLLERHPAIHGFLLRGHGLYTWGATTQQAKRHVEILEFLLEVIGRRGEISRP